MLRDSLATLTCFAEDGSEGDAYQQTFRREEAAHGLSPGFLLVLQEHSHPLQFERGGSLLDIVHFKLQPGLRSWNTVLFL